jgi:hypothetical protein
MDAKCASISLLLLLLLLRRSGSRNQQHYCQCVGDSEVASYVSDHAEPI